MTSPSETAQFVSPEIAAATPTSTAGMTTKVVKATFAAVYVTTISPQPTDS